VRYWVSEEDEDSTREFERISRVGGVPPAPISLSALATMALLILIHAASMTALAMALVTWFQ